MNRAISDDGTSIAFERFGEGHSIILVGGATCDRAMTRPLAEVLAKSFAVINYDRRGRGDTQPYAVEREIEDIAALIAEGLPDGWFSILGGQEHVVPPGALAPELAEFFDG